MRLNPDRIEDVMRSNWIVCLLSIFLFQASTVASEAIAKTILDTVAKETGRTNGFCVDLGCGDGSLSAALVKQSEFYVHALQSDPQAYSTCRSTLETTEVYGERCSVQTYDHKRLPYPDHCANLIVRGDFFANGVGVVPAKEVLRVLQPGGLAYLGQPSGTKGKALTEEHLQAWLKDAGPHELKVIKENGIWFNLSRPRPKGMGDWSHGLRATPANSRAIEDDLVKAPFHTAWIGGPRKFTKFGLICASEGRFILRHGGITHTGRWKPSKTPNTIVAYDGWNATKLWSAQLPEPNGRGLIAACGVVLAKNGDLLTCLDGATGKALWSLKPDSVASEFLGWAHVACEDNVVVTSLLTEKPAPGAKKRQYAKVLAGLDTKTGANKWLIRSDANIQSIAIGEGRLYFTTSTKIRSYQLTDGKEVWSTAHKPKRGLRYHGGKVFLDNGVFDAKTGKLLERKTPRGFRVGQHLVGGGIGGVHAKNTETGEKVKVEAPVDPFSPKTGIPKGGLYGRCIPSTASTHCYFFSYSGTVIADLVNGTLFPTESFRANCRTGVIAANGMVYNSPSGCGCTFVIRGGAALVPVDKALYEGLPESNPPPQLEKGPAFGQTISVEGINHDWPAFRGTPARDCTSPAKLAFPLKKKWLTKVKVGLTSPIVAGQFVVMSSNQHEVIALHADSGQHAWRLPLGGAIHAPPTYLNGRVYVGCQDGWMYCVRADNGHLIWRFRGAPHDRKVLVHGKPESVWPIAGGVIAEQDEQGGKIWFYAGRCSHDKVFVHCLNATSGEVIWTQDKAGLAIKLTGIEGGVSPFGVSPNGIIAASKDVLFIPQGPRWPAGIRKSDGKLLWWNKRGDSKERSNMNIQHLGGAELSYGNGILFMGGSSRLSGHNQFFYALDGKSGRIWGQDDPRFFKSVMRKEDGTTIMPQNYKWGVGPIKFGKYVAPVAVGEGLLIFAHYPGYYNFKSKMNGQFDKKLDRKRNWNLPGNCVVVSGNQALFVGGKKIDIRELPSGKSIWRGTFTSEGNVRKHGLAMAAGSAYIVTNKNEVVCLAP